MHTLPPRHPASLKNDAQLRLMQENAALLFRLFAELKPFMVEGSTGVRIQEFCLGFFRHHGFRVLLHGYRDYPAQVCVSRNEVAAHGLPDLRPLAAGDLVTVDVAASRKGFCADSAWTYLIPGGEGMGAAVRDAAWRACLAGMRAGGQRRSLAAIGRAVQDAARTAGCEVLARFAGHGLGRFLHEAPQVVFTGGGGGGSRLEPGLVLNVEPILAWGPAGMALDAALQADGWSWALPAACLSAQFEFSLAILPDQDWRILNFPDQGLADGGAPPF